MLAAQALNHPQLQQLQFYFDVFTGREARPAHHVDFDREEIAAALGGEDGRAPADVMERHLDLHRTKTATDEQRLCLDFSGELIRYSNEVRSAVSERPDPERCAEGDHGFFCQSYCARRRPAALTSINSASRFVRVSGFFARVIQWSADLR